MTEVIQTWTLRAVLFPVITDHLRIIRRFILFPLTLIILHTIVYAEDGQTFKDM